MNLAIHCVLWVALIASAAVAAAPVAKSPVDIGSRVEMFVDDWLIDTSQGVELRLNTPLRQEIVLVTDRPWEGPASAYFTVLRDGPMYRLYYRGLCPTDGSSDQLTCMAESRDGIHFTRPDLQLFDFKGSKANNVVWKGVESHNFAPMVDRNPAAKPEERYKALAGISSKLYAFASPDGIHWRKLQEAPVMTKGAFDSLNIGFWDKNAGLYRCYSRYWQEGGYSGARAVQHCTSTDFIHWTDPQPNTYTAGAPLEHFYTNATWPCPGAPHMLLSFPKRFVPDRTKLAGYNDPGVSDNVIMSSRDGASWDRRFLEPWLRTNTDPHNWTQRSNMPAWGIVETGPEEFSMYVSEHYEWPDNRLRRVTIRRHGFASAHATPAGGEFVTRPLRFSGAHLVLNYATSAAGSVRVEVQDENGTPVPGFALADAPELFGNEIAATYAWKAGNDVSALAGKSIRLRFVLRDADLYAIHFGTR
jgi:hypothetical protein